MNKELRIKTKKSAQEMQDEIFKKMSVDRKLEIGSQLWQLARELVGDKLKAKHGANRSAASFDQYSQNT